MAILSLDHFSTWEECLVQALDNLSLGKLNCKGKRKNVKERKKNAQSLHITIIKELFCQKTE